MLWLAGKKVQENAPTSLTMEVLHILFKYTDEYIASNKRAFWRRQSLQLLDLFCRIGCSNTS